MRRALGDEAYAVAAVRQLAGRIGFAHGKDTILVPERVAVDGLLDRTAWRFATVGHGHDATWWSTFVRALRGAGYDGLISVEHEDAEVSPEHGIVEGARALAAAMGETAS